MPVYIGPLVQVLPNSRSKYAYAARLWADSLVELFAFADRLGLKRWWLIDGEPPHFDLTPGNYKKALARGALAGRKRGRPKRATPLFEGLP